MIIRRLPLRNRTAWIGVGLEGSGRALVFDKDRFIQDCIDGIGDGQRAIREIVVRAASDPRGMASVLGDPEHAGIMPLYRSHDLTILDFVWAPHMTIFPHNHQMFSIVGIFAGREDNVFWRRTETGIEATAARSLGVGDVATLGRDVIHSVVNPLGKMTRAVHVYGGDFFAPAEPRSEWDHETLTERPWNIDGVKNLFREAELRAICGHSMANI